MIDLLIKDYAMAVAFVAAIALLQLHVDELERQLNERNQE